MEEVIGFKKRVILPLLRKKLKTNTKFKTNKRAGVFIILKEHMRVKGR